MISLGMHSTVMLCFMVQAFQDPPLCSSTLFKDKNLFSHLIIVFLSVLDFSLSLLLLLLLRLLSLQEINICYFNHDTCERVHITGRKIFVSAKCIRERNIFLYFLVNLHRIFPT
jgi:hypothetical protein